MNTTTFLKLATVGSVVAALLLPAQGAGATVTSSHCSAVYRVAKTSVYVKSCMTLGTGRSEGYTVYMKNAGAKKAYINAESSYFQFSKDNKSWHRANPEGSSKNRQASHTSGYFRWYSSTGGNYGRTSSDRYARVVWRLTVHTGSSTGSPAGTYQLYSAYKYR